MIKIAFKFFGGAFSPIPMMDHFNPCLRLDLDFFFNMVFNKKNCIDSFFLNNQVYIEKVNIVFYFN